jgi:PTH1 family peptidyl-tRNA hydrolase
MRLVAGLGNPGEAYQGQRHNFGFMAADEIVRRHPFSAPRDKFHGRIAEGTIGEERVFVLCPLTYMNDSGRSVQAAMQFLKIDVADLFVIHDELDLPLGKVRVKRGGGAGGHNGLRSLDAHVGPDYWRIRLGIDHPGIKDVVRYWVLQDFSKEQRALAAEVVSAVALHLPVLFRDGENSFMNKVSLALNPPPPKAPVVTPGQS